MSPLVTVSAASPAASATFALAESKAVKSSLARARLTSVWIRQEMGAIDAYHGQRVSLLWQSKQARRASSSVRAESQTTRRPEGGGGWSRRDRAQALAEEACGPARPVHEQAAVVELRARAGSPAALRERRGVERCVAAPCDLGVPDPGRAGGGTRGAQRVAPQLRRPEQLTRGGLGVRPKGGPAALLPTRPPPLPPRPEGEPPVDP